MNELLRANILTKSSRSWPNTRPISANRRSCRCSTWRSANRATSTSQACAEVAEITGLSTTDVDSVVGFYTLFHEEPAGATACRCAPTCPAPCAAPMISCRSCAQNLGIKVGETTPDGLFTIEEVTCLAGCHRAPMFQVQGDGDISYHENQTVETAAGVDRPNCARQAAEKEASHERVHSAAPPRYPGPRPAGRLPENGGFEAFQQSGHQPCSRWRCSTRSKIPACAAGAGRASPPG